MGVDRTGPRLPSMADLHNIINDKLLVSAATELVILLECGEQEYPTYNKKRGKLTGFVTTCVGIAKLLNER
jgi:hypothetical protein